ncbi:unnamed protein product, partial [Phaeothamnion confervicola]
SEGHDLTGHTLWVGGHLLACYLASHAGKRDLEGASCLELGCGTGLAGIVASHWCRAVTFCDAHESALRLAKRNVAANAH